MGKWFLTDNLATVGWILMIFSADPHEILILIDRLPKYFFLSKLQELEVRICVQPNFPIIILILLNGFH